MRRALDLLYMTALWASALCLLCIAALVGAQVAGRLLDALLKLVSIEPTGFVVLSLSEMSGYLLSAASFLALAATLKKGVHIRVTMILGALPENVRYVVEMATLAFSAFACAWGTQALWTLAYESWQFDDISPGLIPVPLVYPQAAMVAGAAILTIAFIDEFLITLRSGRPSYRAAEDAIALGKEG
jgi:TRAP-type C4-dicarboxylate transport system permease small subunit